ncbi:Conserved plasma membrane protein [Caenorhabditis elegans]|uniref:Conserved plasma membrane protein n=1 Tax=Caenorhabditis elegans TaxID=6239 RepID=Q4W5R3_CAEEL|nr:Conserved plasma membrane protein [Caenorhabditis elegans]CCD67993.1 Conserved plasma membrane protein [Caenorhabditis elegans]|eukprot:NP_001021826.2 Uncharacterized protein CELE_Y71G12B.33 [Caenorhabditis elegans]
MVPSSASYDDRSFVSGARTTQTSDSYCMEVGAPYESVLETSGVDPSMDYTQRIENTTEQEEFDSTKVTTKSKFSAKSVSPLKISYELITTCLLSISGLLLWTAQPYHLPRQQIIVPFQYFCIFGSLMNLLVATIAVYFEWQASKYAITY